MTNTLKENVTFYLSIAAIVALFIVVENSLLSKEFFALSADESGHTLEAYDWYKHDSQLFSIWLPFHKIINGIALHIHYDLLVTPRVTSAFFGLLTLLSLVLLTYQLFENKIVALLTGFLAAIFLPIAVFSILPLIEIYFFFFIVSSIACYFSWLRNDKSIYLWLTAILISLGTTTRYEAWIFALFLLILMAYQVFKSNRTTIQISILSLSIAIIISVFPLYWIYLSAIANENVHGFISSVSQRYHEGTIFSEIKNNVLYLFLIINITSLNIIGLASLLYLTKTNLNVKKYSIILSGTLITFSILSFAIKAMPSHNYWRVAMLWSLLVLPFTAYWLNHLLESSKKFVLNKYMFIISFLLIIYFFYSQLMKYTAISYLTREDIIVGRYLNKITEYDSSKIFVMKDGSDKWKYSNLLITSQKPDQFVTETENFNYVSSDTISISHKLISELLDYKVKFVVIPARTTVKDKAKYLSEMEAFEKWKVFKLDSLQEKVNNLIRNLNGK